MITKVTIEKTAVFGDEFRGVGRTTALVLTAIASALMSPDCWVEFRDHSPSKGPRALAVYARLIAHTAESMQLTLRVRVCDGVVRVMSPWRSEPRWTWPRKH